MVGPARHPPLAQRIALLLDHCLRGGGIWCDRWELYPLAADEAARLDPLDETSLAAATPLPTTPGQCPRCRTALRPFRDPVLPADATIERCAVCDGLWLNWCCADVPHPPRRL